MNVNVRIENLLATGERIAAPAGAGAWAPIANQDEWNAAAARAPLAGWAGGGERLAWDKPPERTLAGAIGDASWYTGGRLNATVSCLDRHAAATPDATAYLYLREDGFEARTTYRELLAATSRLANALRADGVRSGDRVCIYMPLSVEGIVSMLACARIGAIHSVVYAGLGATALRDRIDDAGAEVVIGADITLRRGKEVDLKTILDDAVAELPRVRRVVVWRRARTPVPLGDRERDWDAYAGDQSQTCAPEILDASAPLFILYTSGTTGKPKGVVMTHGGYLAGTAAMLAYTTGLTPADTYWCTSDIGWIVGHSLIVYGALANGLQSIIREGSPDFPTAAAVYETIATYRVTKLYTAPTLARMLMGYGDALAAEHDLTSLQSITCAGEPLNPEAWHFLHDVVGGRRAAVCNQWWQTELASPALGFLPTAEIRPDKSGKAFGPLRFSVRDSSGAPAAPGEGGLLVLETPAPYMFVDVWNDRERYRQYFDEIPGTYTAGDVATIDAEGFITVLGRADDVLSVAGHRIATADVESALVSHPACGEAGVVGKADAIKGEVIKAFVVLRMGHAANDGLKSELVAHVRYHLGPIGTPAEIEFVPKLPKTRSGKIMRRLLKAQEAGQALGDTTTLED
ncbi:MAG: acetate--CoA ligase [Vulcanimicrobiaceae bacterium]